MPTLRAIHYLCHVLTQTTRHSCFTLVDHSKFVSPPFIECWQLQDWQELSEDFLKEYSLINQYLQEYFRLSLKACAKKIALLCHESVSHNLENSCEIITQDEKEFPRLLKELRNAPLALHVLGNQKLLQQQSVAIIGSRRSSFYALQKSLSIAKELCREGITIVSGGAYGCDILAHQGALEARNPKASTIAIFAGGLQKLYPKGNNFMFKRIFEQGGALVSERLWHQEPRPYDFPIRNRIISGLCPLTLVMDASLKSGSLVTAQRALEQGRDLMVLGSQKQSYQSSGTQLLLEEGALSFTNTRDVLNCLKESDEFLYKALPLS